MLDIFCVVGIFPLTRFERESFSARVFIEKKEKIMLTSCCQFEYKHKSVQDDERGSFLTIK